MYNKLLNKIKVFSETVWRERNSDSPLEAWLNNFNHIDDNEFSEKLNALYLLSKFMYFGTNETRELLKSLYRDKFKCKIIHKIRKTYLNTTDVDFIEKEYEYELRKTIFIGLGTASESGSFLLYLFRQVNSELATNNFVSSSDELFENVDGKRRLKDKTIRNYIFIDDFCGSGKQAKEYSKNILEEINKNNNEVNISYLTLMGTKEGLQAVRSNTNFNEVATIFELDSSFKCFSGESRYFQDDHNELDLKFTEDFCRKYGQKLYPSHPLGFGNCQLLLGFAHNTPDNSLPIFWSETNDWIFVFKRYNKFSYGE